MNHIKYLRVVACPNAQTQNHVIKFVQNGFSVNVICNLISQKKSCLDSHCVLVFEKCMVISPLMYMGCTYLYKRGLINACTASTHQKQYN